MKCEKTGMYTILMEGKQWCQGCKSYHESNRADENDDATTNDLIGMSAAADTKSCATAIANS